MLPKPLDDVHLATVVLCLLPIFFFGRLNLKISLYFEPKVLIFSIIVEFLQIVLWWQCHAKFGILAVGRKAIGSSISLLLSLQCEILLLMRSRPVPFVSPIRNHVIVAVLTYRSCVLLSVGLILRPAP